MNPPTKCDIIRAGAAAMIGGQCSGSSPAPDCFVTDLASKRDMYFQTKYSPSGLVSSTARAVRNQQLGILSSDIAADDGRIRAKYGPDAPADISWNDFTSCLWHADGSRGGPHGNRYFTREDLVSLGYQPRPLFGAAALEGQLPRGLTDPVPVWVDRALNPDLAVILIFVILVVVFAVLMLNAYRWTQRAPDREMAAKKAWRAKMEEHDPYRYSAFPSYPSDPNAKWKALVPIYEAEGYDMCSYRKRLGMPLDGCGD